MNKTAFCVLWKLLEEEAKKVVRGTGICNMGASATAKIILIIAYIESIIRTAGKSLQVSRIKESPLPV